jgi:biotin carboxyl carrier protein
VIFDLTSGEKTWRVEVQAREGGYRLLLEGRAVDVDVKDAGRGFLNLLVDGHSWDTGVLRTEDGVSVVLAGHVVPVAIAEGARGVAAAGARAASGPARITAPMPGKIVRVLAREGEEVAAQAGLLVMEAMKMENELRAPRAGRLREVLVREGQAVETGALLAVLE